MKQILEQYRSCHGPAQHTEQPRKAFGPSAGVNGGCAAHAVRGEWTADEFAIEPTNAARTDSVFQAIGRPDANWHSIGQQLLQTTGIGEANTSCCRCRSPYIVSIARDDACANPQAFLLGLSLPPGPGEPGFAASQ
jgi:hypothetical protein